MMNKQMAVRVIDLSVRRGRSTVLHNVSLDIAPGRITGLLGPSGAGKSTLIRSLIGVQAGVRGKVTIEGHKAGSRALARAVSYMSQSAAIYDDLTVAQNVSYFGAALGLSSADVDSAISAVDLGGFRAALVRNLSGGQRSRVALAIALLGYPTVIVLDEPTVGLDPLLRRDLWAVFRRVADAGAAVIVSSHVMDEAARCDDLVLIRDGRVLAHDTLAALYAATGASDPEGVFLALVEAGPADAGRVSDGASTSTSASTDTSTPTPTPTSTATEARS